MRRRVGLVIVAAVGLGVAASAGTGARAGGPAAPGARAAPSADTAASSAARRSCARRGARVLARTKQARIFVVKRTSQSTEYGSPMTLYGCLVSRGRAVRLASYPDDVAATLRLITFAPPFAAYSLRTTSVPCAKYAGENCTRRFVKVVDLRTGKQRALVAGPAIALALTKRGRPAWLVSSSGPLLAVGASGRRQLDSGAIDPASLRASGRSVSWTKDGARASADLG